MSDYRIKWSGRVEEIAPVGRCVYCWEELEGTSAPNFDAYHTACEEAAP